MEQEFYCYYSTQRPVDIGTFPKPPGNAPTEICNFDERIPVEHEAFSAWGVLTYAKPLTEKEISDYELRPSRYNPDVRRTMAEQASFVGPWEERNGIPADIKAEAEHILKRLQEKREPNSPNGTHYMAQVSPDFLARAGSKDTDRLMSMLPFQSLSLSGLEGRIGTYTLILKDENRFQTLVLRRPYVKKKLEEKTAVTAAPASPGKNKNRGQER